MVDTPPSPDGTAQAPVAVRDDSDVNLRAVLWFGGSLVALAVAVHVGLAWWFFDLRGREQRAKESQFPLSAPEHAALPQTTFGSPVTGEFPTRPRLEGLNLRQPGPENSERTAAGKNEEQETKLRDSGVDKKGRPHIGIDQAMRLVVEESKPAGREPAPVRYDLGVPGTGGGSNSGRALPEAKR
jgi:hypothetical protein